MIVFDLQCRDGGETFEAWFRSNADFEDQRESRLVECPYCGSTSVAKAPMAPHVPSRRSDDRLRQLAMAQAEFLKESRWVGEEFVATARAIHSGHMHPEQVHGTATLEQARSLVEEGIPVASLPLPVTPPNQLN